MALFCGLTATAMLSEASDLLVYAAACVAVWVLSLVRPIHGALLPWIARGPGELTTAYTSSGVIESAARRGRTSARTEFAAPGAARALRAKRPAVTGADQRPDKVTR